MPPSMCWGYRRSRSGGRHSLVCGAGGDRAPSRSGLPPCRMLSAGSRVASTISRELRRNAAARSGGLDHRATTAAWRRRGAARRPKQASQAQRGGVANPRRGTRWLRRCGPAFGLRSRPGRVLEMPSAPRKTGDGQTPEPGADRPSPAGGLRGRRDHAHQAMQLHLSSAVRSRPRRVAPRIDGLLAHRARVADAEARTRGRGKAFISPEIDQPTSGGGSRSRAGPLGRNSYPGPGVRRSAPCRLHDALHSAAIPPRGGPWPPRGSA